MNNSLHVALIGHSNTGKSTLFNTLTGYRQKIANYSGVTISGRRGHFITPSKRTIHITDLPGIYSFKPISPDEAITCEFFEPNHPQGSKIDIFLCVVDATQLSVHLRLVLQAMQKNKPMALVINRMDAAKRRGIHINCERLSQRLGIPVIPTQAKKKNGITALMDWLETIHSDQLIPPKKNNTIALPQLIEETIHYQKQGFATREERIDAWVLHPIYGPGILLSLMFLMFQAIFAGTEPIKNIIEFSFSSLGQWVTQHLPANSLLSGLINDAIFAGIGTIFAFLPQILLLFLFIFLLEESGYLPRAAFLLDHLLFKTGLTGRAFIPLLSSFACTIPSIMATRSIQNAHDRLITILILPLITCSARLPIYTLLIAAFIPSKVIWGLFNLQGIILFSLYGLGILSALLVAWVMKKLKQETFESVLLMELPAYQVPSFKNILFGLNEQLQLFLKRIGGIILAITILLWFLCRFPTPPIDATQPAIYYSIAGYMGRSLAILFQWIGFNWQICIALIPGLAAREVAISALATVYSLSETSNLASSQLSHLIAHQWPLPTALSLLAWYVFAPQCLSTLTVIRRETHSWRNMILAAGYLFSLAFCASFITYHVAHLW